MQRVEGAAAFEGERREVGAACVTFDGNGKAVKDAFAAGVALFGSDDRVFRIADAQVFPCQFAVELRLEQVAADAHVTIDVAADDGQQAVEGGRGDVQVERGAVHVGAAISADAVAGEL